MKTFLIVILSCSAFLMVAQKAEPVRVMQIPAMLTPAKIYCSSKEHQYVICPDIDRAIERTVSVCIIDFDLIVPPGFMEKTVWYSFGAQLCDYDR